jgi:hypothetical protein
VEAAQKSKTVQDSSLNEKKDQEIKGLTLQLEKKDQEIKGLTLQLDKKDREFKDLMQIIEELQGIANSVKNEAAAARDAPRDVPRDTPRDVPRDTPRDVPRDVPRDTPRDVPRDTPRSAPRAREFEESKTTLSRTTGTELRAPHTPSTPSKGKFIRNPTPATTSSSASADPFDFSLMASLMSNVHKK